MLNKRNVINWLVWIVAFEIIGFILGLITQPNIDTWYHTLHRSSLTPPGWVFSVVWSILYAFLAIAASELWQIKNNRAIQPTLYCFILQLLMNWAWTPLFFQYHQIFWSFILILALTFLTFLTIYFVPKAQRWISLWLIPYFIWLLFATYLNGIIWLLN